MLENDAVFGKSVERRREFGVGIVVFGAVGPESVEAD